MLNRQSEPTFECWNLAVLQQPIDCGPMDPQVIGQVGYGHDCGIRACGFRFHEADSSNQCASVFLSLLYEV